MAGTDDQPAASDLEGLLSAHGVVLGDLVESLPELVYMFDPEGRLLYWNAQVAAVTGYDDGAIAAMRALDFFSGADRERVQRAIESAFEAGESRVEAHLDTRRGQSHPHLFIARRLNTGDHPLLVGFGVDISARKATEEALKDSETHYRALVEQALAGVCVVEQGVFTYANQRFAEIVGYPRRELEGRRGPLDLVAPDSLEDARERYRRRLEGEADSEHYEAHVLRRNGGSVWVEVYGTRIELHGRTKIVCIVLDITERKRAEQRLRESQRFLETLVANLPGVVYRCENDPDWPLHFVSDGCETLMGYTAAELIGTDPPTLGDLVHPDDADRVWHTVQEAVSGARAFTIKYRLWNRDAGYRWVWEQGRTHDDDAGNGTTLEGFITDITAEKTAQDEAVRLGQQLTNTLESITDAFCTLDADWRFAYLNREAERLFNAGRDELIGAVVWEIFPEAVGTAVEHHLRQARETGRTTSFEDYYPGADRWYAFQVYPAEDGLAVYFRDVTENKRNRAQLEFLALYDPLTRLPNRSLLHDRLANALASMPRSGSGGALLLCDIDDFKSINETFGHPTGDALLQQTAERITQVLRRSDTVARLGGDEFAVLLDDLSGGEAALPDEAATVADKLMAAVTEPYRLGGQDRHVTMSMGIALLSGDEDVDAALKRADLAMYRAKDTGRNARRFFEPAMETAVSSRVQLEAQLRDALTREALELHYQPQVDDRGRVIGAEGLVRWHDNERGWIPPGQFVPVAEQTGLIGELGRRVLEMGGRELARWAEDPQLAELTLALNVSARQFHDPRFVDEVLAVLARTGAPPERLRLELTESVVLDSIEETTQKMAQLKPYGVRFALDDFGTGYSSLAYLKDLPLDCLKIDRAFVRGMADDANDAALARAVIGIAQSLQLGVVAEGVETTAVRELLEAAGCRHHQGFLFSPAVAPAEFEARVRAYNG